MKRIRIRGKEETVVELDKVTKESSSSKWQEEITLSSLPRDIHWTIFDYCTGYNYKSLAKYSIVSKGFQELIESYFKEYFLRWMNLDSIILPQILFYYVPPKMIENYCMPWITQHYRNYHIIFKQSEEIFATELCNKRTNWIKNGCPFSESDSQGFILTLEGKPFYLEHTIPFSQFLLIQFFAKYLFSNVLLADVGNKDKSVAINKMFCFLAMMKSSQPIDVLLRRFIQYLHESYKSNPEKRGFLLALIVLSTNYELFNFKEIKTFISDLLLNLVNQDVASTRFSVVFLLISMDKDRYLKPLITQAGLIEERIKYIRKITSTLANLLDDDQEEIKELVLDFFGKVKENHCVAILECFGHENLEVNIDILLILGNVDFESKDSLPGLYEKISLELIKNIHTELNNLQFTEYEIESFVSAVELFSDHPDEKIRDECQAIKGILEERRYEFSSESVDDDI